MLLCTAAVLSCNLVEDEPSTDELCHKLNFRRHFYGKPRQKPMTVLCIPIIFTYGSLCGRSWTTRRSLELEEDRRC